MKYKILLIALVLIVGFPTVALGGSFTVSLIQGKTPAEAVQILAEQMDSLFGRVENLETQQVQTNESIDAAQLEIERLRLENANLKLEAENIKNQVKSSEYKKDCEDLAKEMPDKQVYDNWGYTPTITTLYQRAKTLLESSNPFWDNEDNKKLVRMVYEEAKPLYEAYIAKCAPVTI